jgi:RNA polymerase sigma-70 factor (ECF subfamily)
MRRLVSSVPDEQLMLRVQDGDVQAFDTLVARHRQTARALARRSCGADLEDEVVQAAFLSLWQHRGKYVGARGSVRSWLLAIVRNRGIDLMRSRASRQRHAVPADPHGWMAAVVDRAFVAEPPHAHVERAEAAVLVEGALACLPEAQRTVVELAYMDGFSQQEIALRLGIPLGTVKGRLRLGLAKLRHEPALAA